MSLVKKMRKMAGKSQNEAAKLIGKTRQTVSLYERGIVYPNEDDLKTLAASWGLKILVVSPENEA